VSSTIGPERWERIQTLFHACADLPTEERRAYLAEHTAGDAALAEQVMELLEEDRRGGSLLDQPPEQVAERILSDETRSPTPRSIGRYRLVRLLGEGGMGVVYLAERDDLGSRVAIKLLRDAWLTPARRERFAMEQRTLAQLNHPSIARLYDADTLPDGTPWFAMEYVEGVPITEFCMARDKTIPERLELFRAVCEAVLHAHQHAVIHRDLKPSNILVTAEGQVKLLDFGIAKQIEELGSDTQRTRTGLRLMTPAYASPEQIRGGSLGVHTDVYSLGVILYELLADRPPFDLVDRTPTEVDRIVTEQEPERPSAAASKQEPAAQNSLAARSRRAAAWDDLDVLCLTAMHKDPARRYRSVDSLIQDLDHYRTGQPLIARADTLGYRLGKFLRRNQRPVAAMSAGVLILLALAGFYTVRLRSTRNEALAEAERTRRIQVFMSHLFEGGDPAAGPSDSLRVVSLLSRGVQEAKTLSSEPRIQAELYQTLGSIYQKLGDLDRADSLLTASWTLRRSTLGAAHTDVARSLTDLGLLRSDQSRFDDAEKLAREGLAIQRKTDAASAGTARALTALGLILQNRGRYDDAIDVLAEAAILDSVAGLPESDRASTLTELANCHFYSGHYSVSDSLNRRVLAIDRKLYGDRHPNVASDRINLGAIAQEQGRYDEAEGFYREALDIYRSWYGPDHFETAASLTMLGRALIFQKRLAEADTLLRQSLAIREKVYGPNHRLVASTLNELGRVAQQRGKLDEAEACFRRMAEIYRVVYDDKHYLTGIAKANLGGVYAERKQYDEAERLFREALLRYGENLPEGHLYVGIARIRLGRVLLRQGRVAEAESTTLSGYRIVSSQAEPSVTWLQSAREDLEEVYRRLNRPEDAERYRRERMATASAEGATSASR
jgi:serine/threonine-protein kinase